MDRLIVLIVHNVRSTHNVGSLLRTAEGLGVDKVYLTGYTPYPLLENDDRLPHLGYKLHKQIQKTALGAEQTIKWTQRDIESVIKELQKANFQIVGLEQTPKSTPISHFKAKDKIALIVGREVEGVEPEILARCDLVVEIPMFGQKESFNVAQAAAMALYRLRFHI